MRSVRLRLPSTVAFNVVLVFVLLAGCSSSRSASTVMTIAHPVTTNVVTTTSEQVTPSTTAPKRQATTTVPAAPKTKTPVITGTPSEILDKLRADVTAREQNVYDSGNFGLFGEIVGPLQKKYAGAATLSYKLSSTEQYYTGTSGDLTRIWDVEFIDAELVLVER